MSDNRWRMFLCCGAALILGAGTLGVGAVLDAETRELASSGVEATARVVTKRSNGSGTGKTHRLFLEVDDSTRAKLSPRVSPEVFERLRTDDRVTVTYVPGRDDVVVLGNALEVQAVNGRARWTMIAGAAVVVAGVIAAIAAARMRRV